MSIKLSKIIDKPVFQRFLYFEFGLSMEAAPLEPLLKRGANGPASIFGVKPIFYVKEPLKNGFVNYFG